MRRLAARAEGGRRFLREWRELRALRTEVDLGQLAGVVADRTFSSRRAIKAIQDPDELRRFLEVVQRMTPKTVLEIGTAGGGSLYLLCRVAVADALLIAVDLPGGPFGGGFRVARAPFYRGFAGSGQRVTLIRRSSRHHATIEKVRAMTQKRGGLDVVFVDGDHTMAGVRADYESYWPLVRAGGLMAFHDINPDAQGRGGDVPRFWREIRETSRSEEIVAAAPGEGFGIGLLWKIVERLDTTGR